MIYLCEQFTMNGSVVMDSFPILIEANDFNSAKDILKKNIGNSFILKDDDDIYDGIIKNEMLSIVVHFMLKNKLLKILKE